MNSKIFSLILLATTGIIALTTIFFWHFVTKPIFYGYDSHGDLSRLGSVAINPPLTHNITYKKHHTELRDYLATKSSAKFSVLTVGDSYSDGIGGAYYQDYLADKYDMSIINSAGTKRYNSWYQLLYLVQFGYLDELGIDTIIFEIGERGLPQLATVPPPPNISREEYEKDRMAYREPTAQDMVPPYALLTTTMGSANINFLKNRHYAQNHEYAASEKVFKEKLSAPFFTNAGAEDIIYFYYEDYLYLNGRPNYVAINDKLNDLSNKLAKKGIRFVFLPIPDKSDLYYPYFARDRGIAENDLFDAIGHLPKQYIFIDSKKVLREAAAKGEKDLFWADDTHWSFKAQQIVGEEIVKALKK